MHRTARGLRAIRITSVRRQLDSASTRLELLRLTTGNQRRTWTGEGEKTNGTAVLAGLQPFHTSDRLTYSCSPRLGKQTPRTWPNILPEGREAYQLFRTLHRPKVGHLVSWRGLYKRQILEIRRNKFDGCKLSHPKEMRMNGSQSPQLFQSIPRGRRTSINLEKRLRCLEYDEIQSP